MERDRTWRKRESNKVRIIIPSLLCEVCLSGVAVSQQTEVGRYRWRVKREGEKEKKRMDIRRKWRERRKQRDEKRKEEKWWIIEGCPQAKETWRTDGQMDGWIRKKNSYRATDGCVGQYILSQSRKLWNTPAPVAMETKGKLFCVSTLAHGCCPEIEGWMFKNKHTNKKNWRQSVHNHP